jgi:pimeloyl-ACP methyl ester carboxylesterase
VLLLVHGTFSQSQMWADELQATDAGKDLLGLWQGRYARILAFSHPTLSVGAWSNAIDLHRALRDVTVPIDVVCHSRGGLVVSWLLRLEPVPVERVVFVGSPLVGTSLAAPDKLRAALDLLANYAEAVNLLGQAATPLLPLAAGVAGLAKILGKALRLGSGLPILDAAIALVPGLATQQAVGNNLDLRQLFADEWLCRPQMSGIGGSFQPDESREPLWKFWKRFTNIGGQVKYAAADLVFPGPNDLVVDVNSMFRLGEAADIAFDDLGVSATTHHTNYFRDPRVLERLAKRLD